MSDRYCPQKTIPRPQEWPLLSFLIEPFPNVEGVELDQFVNDI